LCTLAWQARVNVEDDEESSQETQSASHLHKSVTGVLISDIDEDSVESSDRVRPINYTIKKVGVSSVMTAKNDCSMMIVENECYMKRVKTLNPEK
jgi:hypothetical protein